MTRILLVLLVTTLPASGAAADEEHPLEPADTSSPRATLSGFLNDTHQAYVLLKKAGRLRTERNRALRNRILRRLDLSELPPAVRLSLAKEAAVCLKEVMDRIELPLESDWPGAEQVAKKNLAKWTIPHTDISIVKLKEGPQAGEFLFSKATVERAPEFYELVKGRDYIQRETTTPGFYAMFISEPGGMIPAGWIPDWSRTRIFGQAIWQWVGLVLAFLLALVLMIAIYFIGRNQAKHVHSNLTRYLMTLVFPLAAMLVPLATRYFVVDQLQIYGHLVVVISYTLDIVFLFALTVLIIGAGNRLAELIIATPWIQPSGVDAQLARLACRMLGIAGVVVVLLRGGQQLGIPVTTMLAGVSVSGLALALAAQDSLKNILGSMMIMLDKPFKVGERIVAKGYDGVVEDIGLRSTKIRTLTGHQVSIPNEEMARIEIENIGRRPYLRHNATIELPSNTPSAKIKRALEILRNILDNHEGMAEDYPPRVFLRDVNEGSIGIFVVYWYHPPQYWDFLAFTERVNLQMSEQFEAEGITFAAPALTIRTPPNEPAPQQS